MNRWRSCCCRPALAALLLLGCLLLTLRPVHGDADVRAPVEGVGSIGVDDTADDVASTPSSPSAAHRRAHLPATLPPTSITPAPAAAAAGVASAAVPVAAAATTPKAAEADPSVPLPLAGAISAPEEGETHCARSGQCLPCGIEEMGVIHCTATGAKELVVCDVLSVVPPPSDGADPPAPKVLRSYTQYAACEARPSSASFWVFQALCFASLCGGIWLMVKRRRVVQSLHHRRLDRLVNS